ncbi:MAG TPA: hypothetical protein VMX33_03255 [bacterium]|nr:hypothetical protein [bacterium]
MRQDRRLHGVVRFGVYLALQAAILSFGLPWLFMPAAAVVGLGMVDGMHWSRWVARSWGLLVVAALPACAGIPWSLSGIEFLPAWLPALARSLRLALVLASAAWLSSGMSAVELRDALALLLMPLGARRAGRVARAASMTMAFIPWTRTELVRADEAARLRGSNPARRPDRHLVALAVPLVSRSLDKARHSSDALALRDAGFGS